VGTWEWSEETAASIMCGSGCCRTAKDLFHTTNQTSGTTCYSIVWSAYFKHNTNFTLNNAELQACHTMALCTSRHIIRKHSLLSSTMLPPFPNYPLWYTLYISLFPCTNLLTYFFISFQSAFLDYCLSWVGLCTRFHASVVLSYLHYFLLSVFQ
jgi:hypothetical protein